MKSLYTDKLILWRRVLYEFSKYHSHRGIFYEAGYKNYHLESKLISDGKPCTPDVIGWSSDIEKENNWIVLELTVNDSDYKSEQLDEYAKIELDSLRKLGIQSKSTPLLFICRVKSPEFSERYCQLLFDETFQTTNLELINDSDLVTAIEQKVGESDYYIPEISFTILPEHKDGDLKKALVDLIMSRFSPRYSLIDPRELVMEGLDILSDKVDSTTIDTLSKRVGNLIYSLSKNELKNYITHSGSKYLFTESGKKVYKSVASREKVERLLNNWAFGNNNTLDRFMD